MKRLEILKKCVVLMLAFCMIVVLAFLPRIVADLQDRTNWDKVKFGQMQSVELDIQNPLPPMGKLSLLKDVGNSLAVTAEDTSMSEEEVDMVVKEELERYVDAGLISSEMSLNMREYRPLFLMDLENPKKNWTYWECMLDSKGGPSIGFWIDDETGQCYMSMMHGEDALKVKQEKFLDTWIDIYFSSLGITEYTAFEEFYKDRYTGDNGTARYYSFGDMEYGEICVIFNVYKYGFYMEFPDSLEENNAISNY